MSNKERWLSSTALLIAILPFILLAGIMQMLPDCISFISLNEENEIFLSKYQYLYLALIGIVPIGLVVLARILRARGLVDRNFMFMVTAALVLGILFLIVIDYGIIRNILRYEIDLIKTFEFFGGSVVVASLLLGEISNFMPGLRRNDVLGIKNKYTLSDNRVWVKVHYSAADVYMGTLYAFAMFSAALSIWLDFRFGWVHVVLWVLCMAGLLIWSRVYSRLIYKKFLREGTVEPIAESEQTK